MASTASQEELQLGACYGRYRGWKNVGTTAEDPPAAAADTPAQDAEELPEQPQEPAQATADAPESDATAAAAAVAPPLPGAIVVQFEATAREDFRVGFAPPRMGKQLSQWAYEVAVGFSGNTEVVWRKHVAKPGQQGKEVDLAQVFAGRTCSLQDFVPYWIVVQQGVLVFGIGAQVGVDTIAKFVDASFVPVQQVALTTWDTPATFRNIVFTPVYDAPLDVANMIPGTIVRADPAGKEDLVTPQERDAFQQAYDAAKRRAERFGGDFVPPNIKTFIDPKTIRKLQRTGAVQPGFATGFDLTSQDEVNKREQRMKRFQTPEFAVDYSTETVRALAEGMTQEEWTEKQREKEKLLERARKFGLPTADPDDASAKLKPANAKVGRERCDVRGDTMVEFRDDAIHVYSLDDRFQQVRTNDVLEYFVGYGPSYVEWINDSSCTVVFQDPYTAGRALIALSQEVPPQTKQVKTEVPVAAASGDIKAESNDAPSAMEEDIDMDTDATNGENKTEAAPMQDAGAQTQVTEVPDEDFNRSSWRFGARIGSSSQPSNKKWRILLRKATEDDFPAEKTNKKYHDRSRANHGRQLQQRGRGHRQQDSSRSEMPSRYGSSSRGSGGSSRAHPYRNDRGGNRRRDRRQSDGDFDQDDERSAGGKPSNRIRVNDDGSINLVRESNANSAAVPTESANADSAAEVKPEP
uniref:Farnesoic acid O-methyl transferase domain-containing protein n=1 Tax=Globisporangium ultimum (strain ATCC 200006 / CBS 805.95 / DAOM BR144) TaxID=431595 RepID=K3X2N0_GLOUD